MLVQEMAIVICGVGAGLGRKVAAVALRDGAKIVIAGGNANSLAEHTKSLDPSRSTYPRSRHRCPRRGPMHRLDGGSDRTFRDGRRNRPDRRPRHCPRQSCFDLRQKLGQNHQRKRGGGGGDESEVFAEINAN